MTERRKGGRDKCLGIARGSVRIFPPLAVGRSLEAGSFFGYWHSCKGAAFYKNSRSFFAGTRNSFSRPEGRGFSGEGNEGARE